MPHRLDDHFAIEAREHLDQLESLLALPDAPDAEQLLRLSTGVRTSAQRAGAGTVASVAERLEDAARSIFTANVAWSEEIRRLARETVADLKLLMRALNRWGAEEEQRVRLAIERWDEHASPAEVPIGSLFYDEESGIVEEPDLVEDADEVVPIESLLLRGDAALREALALHPAFETIARGDAIPERPLIDLVDELFDLLDLARRPESAEV